VTRHEFRVYGVCDACDSPIEIERLRATPFASRCFDCQSAFERNHVQNIGRTL
jgi:RNA polymerase-binding transcription factor DksA